MDKCQQSLRTVQQRGFTIVELLIVIVVIGILAAITIVAYNGIQIRARDGQRVSDVATVQKAMELFYADQGRYPAPTAGGAPTWDETWVRQASCLSAGTYCGFTLTNYTPVVSKLPNDPLDNPSTYSDSDSDYFFAYEGSDPNNYLIRVRLEGSNNSALANDADGGWRTSTDGGCNDPWYCVKKNFPW